jgi:hypothetical protein
VNGELSTDVNVPIGASSGGVSAYLNRSLQSQLMDATKHRAHGWSVDRYKLALLLLALAVIPLFYVATWLGVAAVIAIYSLIARLANQDFERRFRKHSSPRHFRKS